METLLQDIRYSLRMLAKNPGFTIIAVLTLALGIGANTAIFSVVNGVLLRPLPYPQPNQLVVLSEKNKNFDRSSISYPNFLDWQRRNSTFASLAAYRSDDFSLTRAGDAQRVRVGMVSAGFFEILGVSPVLGRRFTPEDDLRGASPVALISAGLWQSKFGSSPDIIGKTILMDGNGYTVIGIVPSSFRLESTNFDRPKEVFVPIALFNDPLFYNRDAHEGMRAIGRLKPGVTVAAAQADMNQIANSLAAEYPDADKGAGISVMPMKKDIVGEVQPFLLLLLAAVGFVLLIACVNVANLQLSRSTVRSREFAIRATLGATQSRVIRQLLTESLLLSLAGGALGLCLAIWGTQAGLQALPETLPRAQDVGLDGGVLIFTFAVSLLAGVTFGLAPALKTSRPNLQETLKESGRGLSGARNRAQGIFVVMEMAMALILLIGAGLMIRSLVRLWSVNPGFNPRGVLTFDVSLARSLGANPETARAGILQMEQGLKGVPGVDSVSVAGGALPMWSDSEFPFWLDGHPKPANESEMTLSIIYFAQPAYLNAMGIPLLRGRFFNADDNAHSAPVAVIDERFAKEYFPNEDPIGKRIHVSMLDVSPEIVGIVGHVKQWGLDQDGDAQHPILAQAYLPFLQLPDQFWIGPPSARVIVRTSGSTDALVPAIRGALTKMGAENLMFETRTLDKIVADSLANRRFSMFLLSVFAAIALLLSTIGIYGVISYVVGQRTHEIGIRMALGAQRRDVLQLMLGEGMKMALIGVAIGIAAALALTHLIAKLLYNVSATDPLTFAGVALVLTGVALAACYIPARRAMRVDPIIALRYE
jgi:putative ABC transport system permease protein